MQRWAPFHQRPTPWRPIRRELVCEIVVLSGARTAVSSKTSFFHQSEYIIGFACTSTHGSGVRYPSFKDAREGRILMTLARRSFRDVSAKQTWWSHATPHSMSTKRTMGSALTLVTMPRRPTTIWSVFT